MPIYEFCCQACQRRSSHFARSIKSPLSPVCPFCGGRELSRMISSFAFHKSEQTRLKEAGEPQMFGNRPEYYKDPRNIGRWAEKRLKELGMDIHSEKYWNTFSEVREMISTAREGEMPPPLKDL